MFGASLNYAYRTRDDDPNRVYLYFESRVSLRKVQEHGLFLRLRDVLGYGEVIEVGGTAVIDPVVPYFGVANNANLRGENLQGPYYQTGVGTFGGFFTYQHPLWTLKQGPGRPVGYLRTYTGFGYYVDRIRPYEDSLFAAERPYDAGLTRRGQLRVGLTWDRRDNEWSPRRGALHDVTFDAAGPWTGSTHAWGRVSASLRHYWQLGVPSFVLAHRVTFDSLWGDPPFMPLGEFGGLVPTDGFGGSNAGRGWIRRRYIGRHKAFASLELRFEPLEFKIRRKYIGLGIKGYVDLGLVAQTMSDMLVHWHVSGGPGVLLIWDRFAVIRVDGGFSRETSGFYLQTEHAF
jgi:outer membrane protein assembly factor BamA